MSIIKMGLENKYVLRSIEVSQTGKNKNRFNVVTVHLETLFVFWHFLSNLQSNYPI